MKRFFVLILMLAFLVSSHSAFASGICTGTDKSKEDNCTGNPDFANQCKKLRDESKEIKKCLSKCQPSSDQCTKQCSVQTFKVYMKCCCR